MLRPNNVNIVIIGVTYLGKKNQSTEDDFKTGDEYIRVQTASTRVHLHILLVSVDSKSFTRVSHIYTRTFFFRVREYRQGIAILCIGNTLLSI